jgi:hypothetical protein
MKRINWSIEGKDEFVIEKIAARAAKMAPEAGIIYSKLDALMDLTACHANGNPLRLEDLLSADDMNFSHDVFGIRRHLNRETGKLEGFFSPRYSMPSKARLVR